MRITVVGAGVIGLTSAIRLAEAGHAVRVVAAERTPRTTSDVAAAIHFPYLAEPRERILGWAAISLDVFRTLAEDPRSGVHWSAARIVEPGHDPWWRGLVDGFRDVGPAREGQEYECQVPVVAMPVHMAFLEDWARRLEVGFTSRSLRTLGDVVGADVVVNCSGLGARELAHDGSLFAIQGQVVRVQAPLSRALLVEVDPPTYAIPRPDGVVVGGTAVAGAESTEPDPAVEQDILQRAARHEPTLADATVLGRAVGLRPGRPSIRLDSDHSGPVPVVHSYGHGGSGVTLSWGCAAEAARLVGGLPRVG